ncbi:hemicentin-1-like [Octopus vulgaris]|nr:hemicentin-1-like [Octopus vulgaris]
MSPSFINAQSFSPWKVLHRKLNGVLPALCFLHLLYFHGTKAEVGCADDTSEGFQWHSNLAACNGYWHGHIENGSSLCSPGWRVCSWQDTRILKNLTWEEATSVSGCYAYNAAQDGGRCRQCMDNMEQDDLAGVGKDCPHQNQGLTSCISGGRIDASCCVDSHFKHACHFKLGIASGVLCCRLPARVPKIIVRPPEKMHVYSGLIFLLTCQATGIPTPTVHWYRNGKQITKNNSRFSILTSSDLMVTLARPSDTGLYSCEVTNNQGVDMASSFVTVRDYISGCADKNTEGLHNYKNIHACKGKWDGHVKRARWLCAKGWSVCNPKDSEALQKITCHKVNMAGIGRNCRRLRYTKSSCLTKGRIDVYHPRKSRGCSYTAGYTTGVLCCKRKRVKSSKRRCKHSCQNGGVCVGFNRCKCLPDYKGATCQNPICTPRCPAMSMCIKPGKCLCKPGYTGRYCKRRHGCKLPCFNGGRCKKGKCICPPTHWGTSCQHLHQHILLSYLNRTER